MNNFVSKTDCEQVLKNCLKSDQFEIINFNVESLADKVTGMMAEYYSLTIQFKFNNENITKQFFLKKLSMFHKIQEIMGREQGAFDKEDYVYNFLVKECRSNLTYKADYSPECYLALKDKLFVLEDLSTLNYKTQKPIHDIDHMKLTLKRIAQFHATSIIYEEYRIVSNGKKYSLHDENPDIFKDSLFRKQEDYLGRHWYKNCLATLCKLIDISSPQKLPPATLKKKLLELSEKVYEIVQPSTVFRNVVCHGDLSISNILFQYDESGKPIDCKLVDFQALRYNPPAHDVMTYIYLTAERDIRKHHLNDLLEYYYDCLHSEVEKHSVIKEKHVLLEHFREACEYVLPHTIIQAACYTTMDAISDYPHISLDQDLYKKYVYEDRSEECLSVYKKGGVFKERIDDMLQELCEI